MNRSNKSEVVVITGASAGVGRATARAFARRGSRIGLIARGHERLESTRREVWDLGGVGLVLPADVADAEAVESAASLAEEELGPIDVWVNNAMASVFSPVHTMAPSEYRRVTEVTYLGTVHGTLAALRRMRPRDRGVVVQVGSALAYRSIPLQSAYCAAKHAVNGFTDSLRTELIHDRSSVRVTTVHLPAINTPQFGWVRSRLPRAARPVPPIFQPETAAEAIVWASEHTPRELVVGASAQAAVLGQRLAPALMDRLMARMAWEGQMTDEPADQHPDNLWRPAPGTQGAHGEFDEVARSRSPDTWLATHPWLMRVGVAAAAAAVTGIVLRNGTGTRR